MIGGCKATLRKWFSLRMSERESTSIPDKFPAKATKLSVVVSQLTHYPERDHLNVITLTRGTF